MAYKDPKKRKEYNQKYRRENKEKIAKRQKEYRQENIEYILIKEKEYRESNKKVISQKRKDYYVKNKKKEAKNNKEYKKNNKEKINKSHKDYVAKNRDKVNKKRNEYLKKRKRLDSLFKLTCTLRNRTCGAFKSKFWKKEGSTEILLGTDYETAFQHIENLFTEGMSWENHGEWHIDHKKPLASAKTEEELKKLCHYTNLQPLWALDNIRKGAKT